MCLFHPTYKGRHHLLERCRLEHSLAKKKESRTVLCSKVGHGIFLGNAKWNSLRYDSIRLRKVDYRDFLSRGPQSIECGLIIVLSVDITSKEKQIIIQVVFIASCRRLCLRLTRRLPSARRCLLGELELWLLRKMFLVRQ
jgi:hypothetical protein